MSQSRPFLLVSIDTEEDQWGPGSTEWSTGNVALLGQACRRLRDLGVRVTLFTTYQVAADPEAAAVLQELDGWEDVEIGAHLHPWNTPPLDEAGAPSDSMLKNLPQCLQEAKLRTLTDQLHTTFGTAPRVFRAGRLGLGTGTVNALIRCGYQADSSVAPFMDWTRLDDGPDFVGAPNVPYRLGPDGDIRAPREDGALLEVPISAGYTSDPSGARARLHRRLERVRIRGRLLSGLLSRSGIVRKVMMSPELDTTEDMIALARTHMAAGVPHLHLMFHSSSLLPGATPFASTQQDADRLLESVERFVAGVRQVSDVTPLTVGEFASHLERGSPDADPSATRPPLAPIRIGSPAPDGNGRASHTSALPAVDAVQGTVSHHFTVDVEEYFQVSALEERVPRAYWHRLESRVESGVDRLMELMEEHGATGTFFVLGWVAERSPGLVKRIAASGHEIASHGWDHRRVPAQTPAEFRSSIRRTKAILEELAGLPVVGFRAPSFSLLPGHEWAIDILLEEGHRYDSSLFPIRRPGYGYPDGDRTPYRIARGAGAMLEYPPATLRRLGVNLPAGGGAYLRLLPYRLVRSAVREMERGGSAATLYIHPWELDPEQPRLPVPLLTRIRHYGGLSRVQARVDRLLAEFRFRTIAAGLPDP